MDWYALVLSAHLQTRSTLPLVVIEQKTPQTPARKREAASQELEVGFSASGPGMSVNLAGMSREQIRSLARSITVRVLVGGSWGSGFLVQQQGQHYSILTNHHVLNPGGPYRIQTPDGRIYPAHLLEGSKFQRQDHFLGNDLEILQFSSPVTYAVASLNPLTKLSVGEDVFSSGYPIEARPLLSRGFVFTIGNISLLQTQPFVGGYRIGYTNSIRQGMSGGPLLNRQGEVVGVNGLHAYPLWGNPYVFKDGTKPVAQLQGTIARSSWAIPISTFVCLSPLPKMSFSVPINLQELCSPG